MEFCVVRSEDHPILLQPKVLSLSAPFDVCHFLCQRRSIPHKFPPFSYVGKHIKHNIENQQKLDMNIILHVLRVC